jgi:hypothetical protein
MLMAACVLLAFSCHKPEEELDPQLQLQNKP